MDLSLIILVATIIVGFGIISWAEFLRGSLYSSMSPLPLWIRRNGINTGLLMIVITCAVLVATKYTGEIPR